LRQALVEAVAEGVAHGPQLDVAVGLEGLHGGAGAAVAAADQADFQGFAVLGVDERGGGQGGGAGADGSGLQEFAAVGRGCAHGGSPRGLGRVEIVYPGARGGTICLLRTCVQPGGTPIQGMPPEPKLARRVYPGGVKPSTMSKRALYCVTRQARVGTQLTSTASRWRASRMPLKTPSRSFSGSPRM